MRKRLYSRGIGLLTCAVICPAGAGQISFHPETPDEKFMVYDSESGKSTLSGRKQINAGGSPAYPHENQAH
jgi:hypothetical protein